MMSTSIEGWRIIRPGGGFEDLTLMDEWTFWAWQQGREDRLFWLLCLQETSATRAARARGAK